MVCMFCLSRLKHQSNNAAFSVSFLMVTNSKFKSNLASIFNQMLNSNKQNIPVALVSFKWQKVSKLILNLNGVREKML